MFNLSKDCQTEKQSNNLAASWLIQHNLGMADVQRIIASKTCTMIKQGKDAGQIQMAIAS